MLNFGIYTAYVLTDVNVGKMDSFSNRPDFSKYFKSKARPASVVKNKSVCNEKHFQIDLKKKTAS